MTVIRPGDTIILTTAEGMGPETASRLKSAIEAEFPAIESAVIITGIDGLYVYRPDTPENEDS